MDHNELARRFKALHKPGQPLVIFNAWDPGSALAIAEMGAQAIGTSSQGVARANGYEDGERIPLATVLANARRIANVTQLPVSLDLEAGYGDTLEKMQRVALKVLETGVVGLNIEDQIFARRALREPNDQARRLYAFRKTADDTGTELFINARCDMFRYTDESEHDLALVRKAVKRARVYAEAGANGFFLPGIRDMGLIRCLADESPLPVNVFHLPGMPAVSDLAEAGVARVSYGPLPYLHAIEALKRQAGRVFAGESAEVIGV